MLAPKQAPNNVWKELQSRRAYVLVCTLVDKQIYIDGWMDDKKQGVLFFNDRRLARRFMLVKWIL